MILALKTPNLSHYFSLYYLQTATIIARRRFSTHREGIGLRTHIWILLVLSIFLEPVLFSAPAEAQTQPAVAPTPLPSDADLDALLTSRNWNELGAVLSRPIAPVDLWRKLNWLNTRLEDGGMLLPLLYARNLWIVRDAGKSSDPSKDFRITAGMLALYVYELIAIDGAKCEDQSAPANRMAQLLTGQAAIFAFLKGQEPGLKSGIVDIAIALEKKTAPLRKDDDVICRGGMAEMRAGLENGTQQQVPTPPGQIGKTVAVTTPTGWSPKFVQPDVYLPMQEKARGEMRGNLLKLVGLPS